MLPQLLRLMALIDTEGMVGEARDRRTNDAASGRENEPVVRNGFFSTAHSIDDNRAVGVADGADEARNEPDASDTKQVFERRTHAQGFILVETRADVEDGLWCDDHDFEIEFRLYGIAQTRCGQC